MRGNNIACCIWGALLLAILLGFLFWPLLRDWIAGEEAYSEQLDRLAD